MSIIRLGRQWTWAQPNTRQVSLTVLFGEIGWDWRSASENWRPSRFGTHRNEVPPGHPSSASTAESAASGAQPGRDCRD